MRKLVIFLFFSALFLLYPCVSDSPIVERISTGEVLESVKSFFAFEQSTSQEGTRDEDRNEGSGLLSDHQANSSGKRTYSHGESQTAKNYGAGENLEAFIAEIAEDNAEDGSSDDSGDSTEDGHDNIELDAEEGNFNATLEPIEEAPKKLLDLTLPQLVDDVLDMKIFKYEYKSMLPNLFTPRGVKEEDERTSFGGRILMEEGFEEREEYRLQDIRGSIEGAELTLEVKTN